MKGEHRSRFCRHGIVALALTLLFLPRLNADPARDTVQLEFARAARLEKLGLWHQAGDVYEKLVHGGLPQAGPILRQIKEHYQLCLRHIYQARRLQDRSFRNQVLSKNLAVALKVYDEVLAKIQDNYVDRGKTSLSRLFQQGVEELRLALDDPLFIRQNVALAKPASIHAFRLWVAQHWQDRVIHSRSEAVAEVRKIALEAQRRLGLMPTPVVLEFACGASNSLDEYTVYLTPSQLQEIYDSLRGEVVGIGIGVVIDRDRVLVSEVVPNSPAALANPPLRERDRIIRIDRKPVDALSADLIDERLHGPAGTLVELDIVSGIDGLPRNLVLTRQVVAVPSVPTVRMLDDEFKIGYMQLISFQESTIDELDRGIGMLKAQGMRVMVLDLRGNPGGLFPVAVQVAERFLTEGVIVTTKSQARGQNHKYEANNMAALSVPLVVLIDGDTASAAEIVAGALKENHRARLVGQTTYGKGCIQGVVKLATVPAGLRITLARFLSPRGQSYSGYGVLPDVVVERNAMSSYDEQYHAAVDLAKQLASLSQP